jgi:hypothetical protein
MGLCGSASENQSQSDLRLPWSIGVGGPQEIDRYPILSGEVIDSKVFGSLNEARGVTLQAIFGNLYALIVAIQQVERFPDQLQFQSIADIVTAG